MTDKKECIMDKVGDLVTEKSDKLMTNKKVEGIINNLGGAIAFIGAIAFGVAFIICTFSLMKTGQNYVVGPSDETAAEESVEEEGHSD